MRIDHCVMWEDAINVCKRVDERIERTGGTYVEGIFIYIVESCRGGVEILKVGVYIGATIATITYNNCNKTMVIDIDDDDNTNDTR